MKYAVIVMVTVYLMTLGCNPEPKEETSSHKAESKAHAAAVVQNSDRQAAEEQTVPKPKTKWDLLAEAASANVVQLMAEDMENINKPEKATIGAPPKTAQIRQAAEKAVISPCANRMRAAHAHNSPCARHLINTENQPVDKK